MNNLTQNKAVLYPYILIRFAGENHQAFQKFTLPDFSIHLNAFEQHKQAIDTAKELVSNLLFEWIQAHTNHPTCNNIIQLRRDIYNLRTMTSDQMNSIRYLPETIQQAIGNLYRLLETGKDEEKRFEQCYKEQINTSSKLLVGLSAQEQFQRALLLSSTVLADQLTTISELGKAVLNKKQKRLFYSLLRYSSRMCFKTSPFSYFTPIGSLKAVAKGPTDLTKEAFLPENIKSDSRLNNQLCNLFIDLIVAHPKLQQHIPLRINPTLQQNSQQLAFILTTDQSIHFQQIKNSAVIEEIISMARQRHTIRTIIQQLQDQIHERDQAQLGAYLGKLLDLGLLLYDFGVQPLAPEWPEQLIGFLHSLEPHPVVKPTINILNELTAGVKAYNRTDFNERKTILQNYNTSISKLVTLYEEVPKGANFSVPKQLLYEDAYTTYKGKIDQQQMQEVVHLAEELCQQLSHLDALSPERNRILHFFKSHYYGTVSLIDFFKEYQKAGNHDDAENEKKNDGFALAYQEQYRLTVDHIKARLREKGCQQASTLQLTKDDLQALLPSNRRHIFSRGMFAQPFMASLDGKDQLHVVINSIFQGMGKTIGRFLHLIDPQATEHLREINQAITGSQLLMELSDSSVFNANIHPPLLPYALSIPGGSNAYNNKQQLGMEEISVTYIASENRLALIHKASNQEIIPFDLSLQAFARRSKLYQFLVHFSNDEGISLKPFSIALDEYLIEYHKWDDEDIHILPRITYEHRLILRRKAWLIPLKQIPIRRQQESDAAYFLRLNQWFQAHQIPQQVFLKLQPRKSGLAPNDEYKPQYLHLHAPHFISLFEKLLTKAGKHIYIEEMLPDSQHLQSNPVNELLVQWHN